MSDYNFTQIKEKILQWSLNDISKLLSESDLMEISKNDDEVLLIDLTFENCLAQIIATKPIFAPYQFVSFESMTLDSEKALKTGSPEMVYFFYDSSETMENKVMEVLAYGVDFCSKYVPGQLHSSYINKTGSVSLITEELLYSIHPDDIKKINYNLVSGKFICVDIDAQYLVVKNNFLIFRILPKFFTIE